MIDDFRGGMADELRARYDKLIAMLDEALGSETMLRIKEPCPARGCNCKHFRSVKVPDYKTMLLVAEFWANQGFGRPGQAAEGSDDRDRVVLTRKLVYQPDGD